MCDNCNWESHAETAEEMMWDEEFDFARDTVEGIYNWVVENEHITEAQIQALENIYGSKQ